MSPARVDDLADGALKTVSPAAPSPAPRSHRSPAPAAATRGQRQRRSRAGSGAHGRGRRSRAGRARARPTPCRDRSAASRAYRTKASARRPIAAAARASSRPPAALERDELPRLAVEHLDDAADGEGDDRLAHRHRLDHRARQWIGVHARHDGDVEVGDQRANVGAEAQHPEPIRQARATRERPALLDVIGTEVLGRIADDDEGDALSLLRGHRVERESRRAHHLDVSLAAQHAPVAAEDDRVGRESQLGAQRAAHAGGIEVGDVERVVDDAAPCPGSAGRAPRPVATRTRSGARRRPPTGPGGARRRRAGSTCSGRARARARP